MYINYNFAARIESNVIDTLTEEIVQILLIVCFFDLFDTRL